MASERPSDVPSRELCHFGFAGRLHAPQGVFTPLSSFVCLCRALPWDLLTQKLIPSVDGANDPGGSGRAVPSLRRLRLPILSVKPILGQALADRRDFFSCDPSVIARRRSLAGLLCVRGVSCILDTGAHVKVTRTCVSPLRSLRTGYIEVEL